MDKLKLQTTNIVDENIKRIGELFPNCLTERLDENGKPEVAIDFDQLRQELSKDIVEGPEERYQFTWPDKRNAIRLANAPTTDTLRPCREESVDFDNTQNLYIEGDNLEVLKLLRENHLGKVKMIYIDPPYNTGNDFVYNDDFAQTAGDYVHNSGQEDEEGNRLVANTESNGRFHTDWLNMIYPRLKVAKDILSEEGVCCISIDEHEINNLVKIGSEIFGIQNYVGSIVVKSNPRGSMAEGVVASLHEYLAIFCRDVNKQVIIGHKLSEDMLSEYKYSDSKGAYRLLGLRMRGGFWRRTDRPKLYFPIFINPDTGEVSINESQAFTSKALPIQPSTGEDGTWRWSKEKITSDSDQLIAKQVARGDEKVWDVFQKDYLDKQGERRTKIKSIWDDAEINYQNGTIEVKELLGSSAVFSYPKPVFLLSRIFEFVEWKDGDIVLDFFSGSATTAHAVMQLNAEDGGNRRFIMVQLPETTDEKSEAYKAGYKNICEIGKERIRRAGKKIVEEQKAKQADLFSGEQKPLDTGFRVLKLDSSNMQDVYYSPEQFNENLLFEDNIKPDRTEEDLLFQAMIELGIELSAKIEKQELAGKTVWSVANGYLMACFDTDVNETTIIGIARQKPYYFVMRDSSLATDNVADNFEQIWEEYSKETIRRII
jgi:adenine-specific DNA-methyltransferase